MSRSPRPSSIGPALPPLDLAPESQRKIRELQEKRQKQQVKLLQECREEHERALKELIDKVIDEAKRPMPHSRKTLPRPRRK